MSTFSAIEPLAKTLPTTLGMILGALIEAGGRARETVVDETTGATAWDRLLAMRTNEDETWRDGGRPANIGWALDDLVKAVAAKEAAA